VQLAQAGEALGASYRFVRRLGSGAIGEVWAVENAHGEEFAAKLLKPEHAEDPQLVERFVRERSVLIGLRSAHIVPVRDMVVEGPRLAIVMDLVPGGSLRDALARSGLLRPEDAFAVVAQVFDALAAAHGSGVVHRDIKPDNVLLTHSWGDGVPGEVKVSDFGIASVVGERIRQTTGLIGTPQYMSPELISQGRSGFEGDVYSAGILLYELLAGRTPFAGPGTDFTIAYRHVTSQVPRLELPPEAWSLLDSLLSKDPAQRPTAAQAAASLRNLAPGVASLPPLAVVEGPDEFDPAERPATVVRGSFSEQEAEAMPVGPADVDAVVPHLGEAGSATVVRPMPRRESTLAVRSLEDAAARTVPWWRTRRAVVLAVAVVVLAVVGVVGVRLLTPAKEKEAASTVTLTSHLPGAASPTGLSISRDVSYDPAAGRAKLTITYSAQRAPLSGDLLEVLPGLDGSQNCPSVDWGEGEVSRNRASVTGVDAPCGWTVTGAKIPAGATKQLTASVDIAPADQQGLDAWLRSVQEATASAVANPKVKGTAYPVQRLQGIEVRTSARVVSSSAVSIRLLPVWAGGVDELNPLYVSPSAGRPSSMLVDIAGGEQGVRFSDGCAGALAVSGDGLTVTALQIAPQCTVRASVGNLTDLQSAPFSVTSREGQ